MIYLISGSPRAGKTTLSKKLSKKLEISFINVDALRCAYCNSLPKKEAIIKFPIESTYNGNNDKLFKKYTAKVLLHDDIVSSKNLWPILKNLILHFINTEEDVVIEGVNLLPKYLNFFNNKNYKKYIRMICLIKKDENKILEGLKNKTSKHDWLLDGTKKEETLIKASKMLGLQGLYFEKESSKYNINFINTEDNFKKEIDKAINYLCNK